MKIRRHVQIFKNPANGSYQVHASEQTSSPIVTGPPRTFYEFVNTVTEAYYLKNLFLNTGSFLELISSDEQTIEEN